MRSIWKGHLRFSLVTIPIRVYNAVDTAESVSFNQLHKGDCLGRVGYDKRCKKCEKRLAADEIAKGFEYDKDQYVVIDSDDLERVKLKSTKVIDITAFVDAGNIPLSLYESPYFAGPDGAVATQPYALLRDALLASGKVGIGKVVLRDREDPLVITASGPGLAFYKLRFPNEIRSVQRVPGLDANARADSAATDMCLQLIDSMTTDFAHVELVDQYQAALHAVIDAKIKGVEPTATADEPAPAGDVMAMLRASIDQAKSARKPMTLVGADAAAAKPARKRARKAA